MIQLPVDVLCCIIKHQYPKVMSLLLVSKDYYNALIQVIEQLKNEKINLSKFVGVKDILSNIIISLALKMFNSQSESDVPLVVLKTSTNIECNNQSFDVYIKTLVKKGCRVDSLK